MVGEAKGKEVRREIQAKDQIKIIFIIGGCFVFILLLLGFISWYAFLDKGNTHVYYTVQPVQKSDVNVAVSEGNTYNFVDVVAVNFLSSPILTLIMLGIILTLIISAFRRLRY
jgi:hypothetical protein